MTTVGTALVWSGLAAAIASVILYIASLKYGKIASAIARWAFVLSGVCVLGTAIVHSTLLMTHRFDVAYVYHYSARGLPTPYLFSTFWAGQEGSFLLWTFWTALLGVVLACTAGPIFERRVMSIYGVVLSFLLLLLVIKSPFVGYLPINPGDPLHPTDGQGLNPLLENPWMVIHPPTLFLGFASLAVPFSFTLSALIWRDAAWYRRTWPWALFSFSVLGFGVMLGGYWAYETLGWGGFWGWDPVENGPLVPWLGMTAFLHALQVHRVRGSLKKTSLFLGFFPFIAALYETFLTRTGILDKFSNHSFSTLGGIANSVILYGLLFAVVVSLILLAVKGRQYTNESNAWENASSKEFGFTMAIIILMLCAVITGVGMSAPLITQGLVDLHLTASQSSVQPDFYNKANFPVAILLTIGMGLGPYLAWRKTKAEQLISLQYTYPTSVGLTALAMFVSWKAGFRFAAPQLILLAGCLFALIANAQILFATVVKPALQRTQIRTLGGQFSHIGGTFILIGIICLVTFTKSDKPLLVQGHTRLLENLPYSIAFTGMTSNLNDPKNDLKFTLYPTDRSAPFTALMPFAVRNVEGQKKLLARPAIFNKWWGDLYIAMIDGPDPLSPTPLQKFSLDRGRTTVVDGYKVTFDSFYVDRAIGAMVQANIMPRRFPVTAIINVQGPDGSKAVLRPQFIRDEDDPIHNPISPELRMPGKNGNSPYNIAFTGMAAGFDGSGQASFYMRDASMPELDSYTIEVSTRPGIGLVWIGTVLISLGGLLSMRRRSLENKLNPPGDGDRSVQLPIDSEPEATEHAEAKRVAADRKPVGVAMRDMTN
jgi:cytochrome c-type biogenesis protein CcmF